jgi:uncharacterized DUF497 family protein
MEFEWDDDKAEANERKHGVTFAEAATPSTTRTPPSSPTKRIRTTRRVNF